MDSETQCHKCNGTVSSQSAGQTGQHWPFVVVGAVSDFVQSVGKHQTSEQNVLALPPNSSVAPVRVSTLIAGLTQYGQQCPGYSVRVKPAGHLRSGHSTFPQGSTCLDNCLDTWTSILVFMSRSRATTYLPAGFRNNAAFPRVQRSAMQTTRNMACNESQAGAVNLS